MQLEVGIKYVTSGVTSKKLNPAVKLFQPDTPKNQEMEVQTLEINNTTKGTKQEDSIIK